MRGVIGIMKDAIDRRSILVGGFAGDHPTSVAVPVKSREVAARHLKSNAVTW